MPGSATVRLLRRLDWFILVVPLLFLLAFFFAPLANILQRGLSAGAVAELLSRPYFLGVLWFTLWQAIASTLLTLLLGLPAAFLFARFDFPAKRLLRSLTTVPFVLPTVVVAVAFQALLGPAGPVNRLLQGALSLNEPPVQLQQSVTIILLAHIFYNLTIVVRLVGGFWANLSPGLTEGARVLGASPLRAFWEITLPLLRPPLIGASLLIFLFTFTSFGVVLLLGGPQFSTVETEIYRQYVTYLRPDVAAALSLLQIAFTFILMLFYARWQQRSRLALNLLPREVTASRPATPLGRLAVGTGALLYTVLAVTPLLALVWRSVTTVDGSLTLAYYEALPAARAGRTAFIPPLQAVRNSLGYALLTMISAGTLGVLTATALAGRQGRRWLDATFMLPLGASAVTLGFGYLITFPALRTSPLIVWIAHTLVALPFVVRTLLPVLQGIRPSLREAASILGAGPWRVWREVDLPIIGRALLVGLLFAFTVSMGEFGATSFIARPDSDFLTLPIAIQRYLGQPGALNFGQAVALSTVLMAVCAAGFVGIERFRYADIGEF